MMKQTGEYLVKYGKTGAFGRFSSRLQKPLKRGDRVIIRSIRGVEDGSILCLVSPLQNEIFRDTPMGEILRSPTPEDEGRVLTIQKKAREIYDVARQISVRHRLPLEVLDVEVMLEGDLMVLQFLAWGDDDLNKLIESLEAQFALEVMLEPLSNSIQGEKVEAGCGKPNCGQTTGGGCSSCGTGGCSSCGTGGVDMRDYFSHLRQQMEQNNRLKPLL